MVVGFELLVCVVLAISLWQPFILFPEDAVFRQCKSCPTGRVFYLKFANDRREFFWMQELSSANDASHCTRLNDLINNPAPEPEEPTRDGVLER
jgi:hypothetical protein